MARPFRVLDRKSSHLNDGLRRGIRSPAGRGPGLAKVDDHAALPHPAAPDPGGRRRPFRPARRPGSPGRHLRGGDHQPAGPVLQPDRRRRQEGRGCGGRQARGLQCQQRAFRPERRHRDLHHPEGGRHRAGRHRRQRREARHHGRQEGRHPGHRRGRPDPGRRQRRLRGRRQRQGGRADRQLLRRLREEGHGRQGQGRHRGGAQLLHPEPAARRLQEDRLGGGRHLRRHGRRAERAGRGPHGLREPDDRQPRP